MDGDMTPDQSRALALYTNDHPVGPVVGVPWRDLPEAVREIARRRFR